MALRRVADSGNLGENSSTACGQQGIRESSAPVTRPSIERPIFGALLFRIRSWEGALGS
jgi:hypothetical protein